MFPPPDVGGLLDAKPIFDSAPPAHRARPAARQARRAQPAGRLLVTHPSTAASTRSPYGRSPAPGVQVLAARASEPAGRGTTPEAAFGEPGALPVVSEAMTPVSPVFSQASRPILPGSMVISADSIPAADPPGGQPYGAAPGTLALPTSQGSLEKTVLPEDLAKLQAATAGPQPGSKHVRIELEADAQKRSDLVQPEGALDLGASRTAMQQVPATVSPEPDPRGASVPRGAGVPAGAVGRAGDYWDFSRARVVAEREVYADWDEPVRSASSLPPAPVYEPVLSASSLPPPPVPAAAPAAAPAPPLQLPTQYVHGPAYITRNRSIYRDYVAAPDFVTYQTAPAVIMHPPAPHSREAYVHLNHDGTTARDDLGLDMLMAPYQSDLQSRANVAQERMDKWVAEHRPRNTASDQCPIA